jgi:MacB-like protein
MLIKQVLRRLVKAAAFTAIAVLTLAIGIGANGAIFSVVNGILLKPLRYTHPEELVAVDHAAPGVNLTSAGAAPFLYFTYRERSQSFRDVGLWRGDTDSVTGVGEPEEIQTVDVTDGTLPILGVKPLLGRLFTRADDTPAGPATMILSYGYWRSRFGGDPQTIGRRVMVNGQAREVIGVLPAAFRFLDRDAAAFMPLRLDRSKVYLGRDVQRSGADVRERDRRRAGRLGLDHGGRPAPRQRAARERRRRGRAPVDVCGESPLCQEGQQEEGVDEREDGCVGTDAERQGEHGGQGQGRSPCQAAERDSHVGAEVVEQCGPRGRRLAPLAGESTLASMIRCRPAEFS